MFRNKVDINRHMAAARISAHGHVYEILTRFHDSAFVDGDIFSAMGLQKLRQQLEKQFGVGYAAWVAELGETRKLILASDLDKEHKLELLHSLASREAVEAALEDAPVLAAKGEGA